MQLRGIEIKNYQSLENVELQGLSKFNILIGRNNAGKSSVFGALLFLSRVISGDTGYLNWGVITAKDYSRPLELCLKFELSDDERAELIRVVTTVNSADKVSQNRLVEMQASLLFRNLEFRFKSVANRQGPVHLHETRLADESGELAIVQSLVGNELEDEPESRTSRLNFLGASYSALNQHVLDVSNTLQPQTWERAFLSSQLQSSQRNLDPGISWILKKVRTYLSAAFFFNPFRHSTAQLADHETHQLAQDGSNLAQVLLTIQGEKRTRLEEIERFIHALLPDIGILQLPLKSNLVEVTFLRNLRENYDYDIRLHDMGGGIEQLLMVATVLFTTKQESTLFLEEPESHLHPGAQRYLAQSIVDSNHQVFLTTHSPTFVNLPQPKSVYLVKLIDHQTQVSHVNHANELEQALEDIGSRVSDVLMSHGILFVEGGTEKTVFETWGETLNMNLSGNNIAILPMGGGESRNAKVRSKTLEEISQRTPIPHLIVLDRDERKQAEIDDLKQKLGEHLHLLTRRELENYFLNPGVIRKALKSKYNSNSELVATLNLPETESHLERTMCEEADKLYGLVLIKRIRAELGGLREGYLPRELAIRLAEKAQQPDFPDILIEEIENFLEQDLQDRKVKEIIQNERNKLESEWAIPDEYLRIAPGQEILEGVYKRFGGHFEKSIDTPKIACEMHASSIDSEIVDILDKIIRMVYEVK